MLTTHTLPAGRQDSQLITVLFFFLLAFLERTVFDLGPNVELVTLAMLAASTYLSRNTALKLVFILMAATDLIIGNTNIFIFTWSGFLAPIILIKLISQRTLRSFSEAGLLPIKMTGVGLLSNLFFYTWTNFGVWLLDSWGMYPKTLAGLINCYVNGLPFLKLQLESTLLFVPLGFTLLHLIQKILQIPSPIFPVALLPSDKLATFKTFYIPSLWITLRCMLKKKDSALANH